MYVTVFHLMFVFHLSLSGNNFHNLTTICIRNQIPAIFYTYLAGEVYVAIGRNLVYEPRCQSILDDFDDCVQHRFVP